MASQQFSKTNDQYDLLSAGIDVNWQSPGRQQVLASACLSQTRYSRYSSQDNEGYCYLLSTELELAVG